MTFSKVKEILNKDIIFTPFNVKRKSVTLIEHNPNSRLKKVEISDLHKDTVVFKLDPDKRGFNKKSPFLSNHKGLHAGCDYVIVTRYQNENIILFCELKSNSMAGAKKQLKCSVPFIDYMVSLLATHFNVDFNFKRHFVVLSTKKPRKQNIKKKPKKLQADDYKGLTIKLACHYTELNIGKIIS